MIRISFTNCLLSGIHRAERLCGLLRSYVLAVMMLVRRLGGLTRAGMG